MNIKEPLPVKLEDALITAEKLCALNWVDLAVEVLTRAKGLAGNGEQEAEVFSRLGEYHIKKGDYELAVIQLENAMGRLLHRPDSLELFYIYRNIAWTFWRQGYLERADNYAEGARTVIAKREHLKDNDTNKARASLFHLKALLAGAGGDFKLAIEFYQKETEILELYNFPEKLGPVYGNLSGIYLHLGNYAKAIDYQLKSMETAEKRGDLVTIGIGCNNLGEIYHNLGNYQKPELFFNRYLEINSRINNALGDSFALAGLARLHTEWRDYTRAEALYRNALVKAMAIKSKVREANILANMAILYGLMEKNDQALKQVDRAIEIYGQIGRIPSQWHQIIKARVWYQMSAQEPERKEDAFYLLEQTVAQPLIIDDEQDISSQETALEAYVLLARLCLDKNDTSLAEEHLKKARFFIDQLTQNIPAELQDGFLSKPLVKRVYQLEEQLAALVKKDRDPAKPK
jgi:tetratricopeptide (TPR) repeat protein